MKLTKEECERALEILKKQHDYLFFNLQANYPYTIEKIREVQICFIKLIKEHFDNPPLKFEELKEGMWVWDNKTKEYIVCSPNINVMGQRCVCYWCGYTFLDGEFDEDYIIFEENRFFRKEFQKND